MNHHRSPVAVPGVGDFQLHFDAWGHLVYESAAGERHTAVVAARAFPLSHRICWVVICTAAGDELVTIEDPGTLPEATRDTLLADLNRREFLPAIRRIVGVSGIHEPCEWDVETDRGSTKFVLKNEDDVRRLGDGRALVIDSHGLRYLIEDATALDAGSRRILERYLY